MGRTTETTVLDLSRNPCLDAANNDKTTMEPITPDANKEKWGIFLDLNSPLTVAKKIPFDSKTDRNQDAVSSTNDAGSSPKTPKDGVFDPFAPGPEDKAWAPQCKKYSEEARNSVAKRLNYTNSFKGFGDTNPADAGAESSLDQHILRSVYEDLLDAILCNEAEILCNEAEIALVELSTSMECDSDGSWTPPSNPILSGIANTCPRAPMKPSSGKSRIIDLGLCRKLEF